MVRSLYEDNPDGVVFLEIIGPGLPQELSDRLGLAPSRTDTWREDNHGYPTEDQDGHPYCRWDLESRLPITGMNEEGDPLFLDDHIEDILDQASSAYLRLIDLATEGYRFTVRAYLPGSLSEPSSKPVTRNQVIGGDSLGWTVIRKLAPIDADVDIIIFSPVGEKCPDPDSED